MKVSLKKLFTTEQHKDILFRNRTNSAAAAAYTELCGKPVSRQLVAYWRTIYSADKPNAVVRQLKNSLKLVKPSPNDDVGNTQVPVMSHRILVIPDTHCPYMHQDALEFLKKVRDEYQPDTVVHLGDECFPPEAELLTEKGWVTFGEYVKDPSYKVVQVHSDLTSSLVEPVRTISKKATEGLLKYKHKTCTSITTPRHNLVLQHPIKGTLHRREAWDLDGARSWHIPRSTNFTGRVRMGLTDDAIRLQVAFQADGCFTKGAVRFSFTKKRKADRLVGILKSLGVPYTQHEMQSDYLQYYIKKSDVPSYLTKVFNWSPYELSLSQRLLVCDEVMYWDGTLPAKRYTSTIKSNVEFVQLCGVLSGLYSSRVGVVPADLSKKNHSVAYYVNVRERGENTSLKSATQEWLDYIGDVHCVTVPTGMIMVRQEGDITVSGNCDQHALSFHDSDPNLDSAGVELEKAKVQLEGIHKMFPNVLLPHSNHGSLIYRRAFAHGIPIQYIKKYRDILFPQHGAPGWSWADAWHLETPMGTVRFVHQTSGDFLLNAAHEGVNLVQGHEHGQMTIKYAANSHKLYFAAKAGCLIDPDSMAFAYGKLHRNKPLLGIMTITEGCPAIIPMLLDNSGRWVDRKSKKS